MTTQKKSATKKSTTKKTTAKTSTAKSSSGKKSANTTPSAMKGYPLNITTEGLPPFFVGEFKQTRIEASGGTPPYTFSVQEAGGSLPEGLNFNSQGTLSGTPVQAGMTPILVQVRDLVGGHQGHVFELYIEED